MWSLGADLCVSILLNLSLLFSEILYSDGFTRKAEPHSREAFGFQDKEEKKYMKWLNSIAYNARSIYMQQMM